MGSASRPPAGWIPPYPQIRNQGTAPAGGGAARYPSAGNSLPLPPGTPTLWYDASNTDAFYDTLRADGVSFLDWINLGAQGTTGTMSQATAGSRPLFRTVGGAGKINNLPAVANDGTRHTLCTFTDIPQPITYAMIMLFTTVAGTPVAFQGGALGTDGHELFSNTANPEVYCGTFFQVTSLTFQANKWHMFLWQANGASSLARLDGVAASAPFDNGSNPLGGCGLFSQVGGGNPMVGSFAEFIAYSGALATHPALTTIEAYFKDKYGAGFPQ